MKHLNGLLWLGVVLLAAPVMAAKPVDNQLSCQDFNESQYATGPNAQTRFIWKRDGKVIFNKTFTDAYSESRDAYVTFYCEGDFIKYRLFACTEPDVAAYCGREVAYDPQLLIGQKMVNTKTMMVDGDDYNFITHYTFKSANNQPVQVDGLYFVNSLDDDETVTTAEASAASQFEYVFLAPEGERFSGVQTSDGTLYFDLKNNPIIVREEALNIGLAARPSKAPIDPTVSNNIRWMLDESQAASGVVGKKAGRTLAPAEVTVAGSKPAVFSRGIATLKIRPYSPQSPLFTPASNAQPFYRFQLENISKINALVLKRGTVDMRLIGMQKANGADFEASDFSLFEMDANASNPRQVSGVVISKLPDYRNDNTAMSVRMDFDGIRFEPGQERFFELRVANTADDSEGKDWDDGVAAMLRIETFRDYQKLPLSSLEQAHWIWSDLSAGSVSDAGSDWRSGITLDLSSTAIIMKESDED